ncbi:MAG: helix-turn-helix domain-containing protein [Acetivibrionales bacterium]|jgi:transcriptional regulator with XRE-family HTH domain
MATLRERLNTLIEKTGLQQKEIANLLNIKVSTFNGYVNGIREPNIETLIRIARFFNVTVDYIVGNDDTNNTNENVYKRHLEHLDEGLNDFVSDPDNRVYLEIARDIMLKTGKSSIGGK